MAEEAARCLESRSSRDREEAHRHGLVEDLAVLGTCWMMMLDLEEVRLVPHIVVVRMEIAYCLPFRTSCWSFFQMLCSRVSTMCNVISSVK